MTQFGAIIWPHSQSLDLNISSILLVFRSAFDCNVLPIDHEINSPSNCVNVFYRSQYSTNSLHINQCFIQMFDYCIGNNNFVAWMLKLLQFLIFNLWNNNISYHIIVLPKFRKHYHQSFKLETIIWYYSNAWPRKSEIGLIKTLRTFE